MTRRFIGDTFRNFFDRESGAVFEDLEFVSCTFANSAVSVARDPRRRSTIRRVKVVNCVVERANLWSAVVEDSEVDGLRTRDLTFVSAAVFRHVTLKGRLGRFKVTPWVEPSTASVGEQRAFDRANANFYRSVDWALDLTEAEFEEIDLEGVPTRLIRRDPATQVVVTREKAIQGTWRSLDLTRTHWAIALNDLIESGRPDGVLIAPRGARNFGALKDGLKMLRDVGVAEPD